MKQINDNIGLFANVWIISRCILRLLLEGSYYRYLMFANWNESVDTYLLIHYE